MNSFEGPFFKGSTLTYRTRRQVRKSLSPFFIGNGWGIFFAVSLNKEQLAGNQQ